MAKKQMSYKGYKGAADGDDMTYKGYVAMAKGGGKPYMSPEEYKKAEQDFVGAEDKDDDDDDDDKDDDAEKSLVDASDLMKAIGDYEVVEEAVTLGGNTRESVLTAKFNAGTISKSEQAELGTIWAGDDDYEDTLHKSLLDVIEDDDPDAAAMVDASDFLKSLVNGVNTTMGAIRDDFLRDGENTRQLLRGLGALTKSMGGVIAGQDELIKSQNVVLTEMGKRLGVLESEPVVRKSMGADPRDVKVRPPAGGGRGDGEEDRLTKAMAFQAINSMLDKADKAGDDVAIDRLSHASTLLESTGQMQPNILAAVKQELGR
jgi:hypothetical protein